MLNLEKNFLKKRILIYGLGKSGLSTYSYLKKNNIISLYDDRIITKKNIKDTYTTYKAPNFFLRAGDFRTRLEAEKIKAELKNLFPTSFIVKEKVNLPRLEKDRKNS